jgi:hypothetical protein
MEFEPRSNYLGFVVDKVAPWQVSSEYFRFRCQFSFHRLLHTHHHQSSVAGTIGQQWPSYQLDPVSTPFREEANPRVAWPEIEPSYAERTQLAALFCSTDLGF